VGHYTHAHTFILPSGTGLAPIGVHNERERERKRREIERKRERERD
jgi:hypothetical protein